MQNLIPLLFIGFFIYLIFSRKGGMGGMGVAVATETTAATATILQTRKKK